MWAGGHVHRVTQQYKNTLAQTEASQTCTDIWAHTDAHKYTSYKDKHMHTGAHTDTDTHTPTHTHTHRDAHAHKPIPGRQPRGCHFD